MDLFDKLSAGLKPLGGQLFVDAFVGACQAESARRAAASRPQRGPRAAQERPAPPPPTAARAEAEDAPAGSPHLQDEVEAFMNRDSIEGADDAEVQEFLKERGGFDPSDIPDQ